MTYIYYVTAFVLALWFVALFFILFKHEKLELLLERFSTENKLQSTAIHDAVEVMTDGVIFADADGRIRLVNTTMLNFMETVFGKQYRNAKLFYKDLTTLQNNDFVELHVIDGQEYVHFTEGRWYRFTCKQIIIPDGRTMWQYLLADVTEEMFVTLLLQERNEEFSEKNVLAKQALLDLEIAQRHKTTDAVMHKIHDLLGQRISILQQVLNNQELQNYEYIAPLVNDVMADLRQDLINPKETFEELVEAYRMTGIEVEVLGDLPTNQKQAEVFVTVLRDALSNAVRHGKAGHIKIRLGYYMSVEDDGVGCTDVKMGTGLSGMQKLLRDNNGDILISSEDGFKLRAYM